jgi:predicted metal-binding membrane protein
VESATVRRAPPLPGLIQLGLIGLLLVLAAIAWALTSDQMSGMDAGPGTDPGTLGFFLGVWVVMMAAMMFPSIAASGASPRPSGPRCCSSPVIW